MPTDEERGALPPRDPRLRQDTETLAARLQESASRLSGLNDRATALEAARDRLDRANRFQFRGKEYPTHIFCTMLETACEVSRGIGKSTLWDAARFFLQAVYEEATADKKENPPTDDELRSEMARLAKP